MELEHASTRSVCVTSRQCVVCAVYAGTACMYLDKRLFTATPIFWSFKHEHGNFFVDLTHYKCFCSSNQQVELREGDTSHTITHKCTRAHAHTHAHSNTYRHTHTQIHVHIHQYTQYTCTYISIDSIHVHQYAQGIYTVCMRTVLLKHIITTRYVCTYVPLACWAGATEPAGTGGRGHNVTLWQSDRVTQWRYLWQSESALAPEGLHVVGTNYRWHTGHTTH